MKLLFENWRKYINEEIENNVEAQFIAGIKHVLLPQQWRRAGDITTRMVSTVRSAIMAQVKPLQSDSLVQYLGRGDYGIAFKMSNNHVLKLFTAGVDGDAGKELKKYKQMMDRQFDQTRAGRSQKETKFELPVYDVGLISGYDSRLDDIGYAEIGLVQTLEDVLEASGREGQMNDITDAFVAFRDQVNDLTHPFMRGKSLPYMRQKTKNPITNKKFQTKLTEVFADYAKVFRAVGLTSKEILGIYRSIVILIKNFKLNKLYDLHLGNFGVSPENPDNFIIYDF